MCRREILDGFMRDRAVSLGAILINGTVHQLKIPQTNSAPYAPITMITARLRVESGYTENPIEVDVVIGADGANSRIAKAIDAGDYNYAIAFKSAFGFLKINGPITTSLVEMYVGNDVSPTSTLGYSPNMITLRKKDGDNETQPSHDQTIASGNSRPGCSPDRRR